MVTTVSVVINNFNYDQYLRAAIDSVLAQTYPHIELIVVDDGSTDRSRGIIASYGDRLTPIFKPNEGQPSTFNVGFAASTGDVVIFLDADDVLLPTAAETCARSITEGVAKAHWPMWQIDEAGTRTGALVPSEPLPEGDLRDLVIQRGPWSYLSPPTSGNAWSRSYLGDVLPMPRWSDSDSLGGDAYLVDLAPLVGSIARIPDPQSCYRVHASNYSGRSAHSKAVRYVKRYDLQCQALERFARNRGIQVDSEDWKRQNENYAWMQEVLTVPTTVTTLIEPGVPFIFVDQDALRSDLPPGYQPIPFLEVDGRYWGTPDDDQTAITELERLRDLGATMIIFTRSSFWWLAHYGEFARYLRSTFKHIADTAFVIAFDLRACRPSC